MSFLARLKRYALAGLMGYSGIMTVAAYVSVQHTNKLAQLASRPVLSSLAVCEVQLEQAEHHAQTNLYLLDTCEQGGQAKLDAQFKAMHSALCLVYQRSTPDQRSQLTDAFRHEHCKFMTDSGRALNWHEP